LYFEPNRIVVICIVEKKIKKIKQYRILEVLKPNRTVSNQSDKS